MNDLNLAHGNLGIERETLRNNPDATLAGTAHPTALGSAYTHNNITTDYAEALLEIVTDPHTSPPAAYAQLLALHRYCAQNIGEEQLWPGSMPCILPENNEDIAIGYYGNSNGGKMRRLYREGLGHRYGKSMQMISGIHFNYSPPVALWTQLAAKDGETANQDYINRRYMGALRAINRHAWLISYLYGASPAVHDSFRPAHGVLDPIAPATLGWRHASSLRMSELGYQNKTPFTVSFNDLNTYVHDLASAVSTPAPRFEYLGLYNPDGSRKQISTHILQIANEYYTAARPKQPTHNNELPTLALAKRGISYLELRLLDINPEDPCGVSLAQLHILEAFMLWCILNPEPTHQHAIRDENDYNRLRSACCGLSSDFMLKQRCHDRPIHDVALELLEAIRPVAARLDTERNNDHTTKALMTLTTEIKQQQQLPWRTQHGIQENGFLAHHLAWRERHHDNLHTTLDSATQAALQQAAADSLAQQQQIEAQPQIDFETYLNNHFTPLRELLP
ncbi:MAG: glutamate--cysteine ligase [Cardiobacteriaceae bacterium]|nr:glutamate--cysteine ligase [Cardiobacteriaceae bacterium]